LEVGRVQTVRPPGVETAGVEKLADGGLSRPVYRQRPQRPAGRGRKGKRTRPRPVTSLAELGSPRCVQADGEADWRARTAPNQPTEVQGQHGSDARRPDGTRVAAPRQGRKRGKAAGYTARHTRKRPERSTAQTEPANRAAQRPRAVTVLRNQKSRCYPQARFLKLRKLLDGDNRP
jgi:hypothetical protein